MSKEIEKSRVLIICSPRMIGLGTTTNHHTTLRGSIIGMRSGDARNPKCSRPVRVKLMR